MNLTHEASKVGKGCLVRVLPDIWVPAQIDDLRVVFGRVEFLINFVGGRGLKWFQAENVEVS